MIPNIDSRSKNADVNSTAISLVNDFQKRDFTSDPHLQSRINHLEEYTRQMTQAIHESRPKSPLPQLDGQRDVLLRAIHYELKAKAHWPDTAIRESAVQLKKVLNRFGMETVTRSYSAESADINALLEDFRNPDLAPALDKLHDLRVLLQQLKNHQEQFEAGYLDYIKQRIEARKQPTATKWCQLIMKEINEEIVVYLNGMARAYPDKYLACARVATTIIDENNQRVRLRRKKNNHIPGVGE
ncbi:hypothetical protein DMA11_17845 [Marinilabiliaceae bacterium JC017]|nr:hypothetical protein DMA11_17845 [Marinilabiliaceae bacterium JC017]